MTPKEEAIKLFNKYELLLSCELPASWHTELIKQCALITVDELIKDNEYNEEVVGAGLNKHFWGEVKQELEKL